MRIAFVSTVKNEEDLIADNICFHSFIGGTDFLIYLDDSTDRTESIASRLPGVRIQRSTVHRHCSADSACAGLISKFSTHHTSRQILNCYDAIHWARANGINWVVSLDPDELVCLDRDEVRKDMLAEFLSDLPGHVKAVSFPSLEVLPTRMAYHRVFREERWFKRNYGFGEGMRYSQCEGGRLAVPGAGAGQPAVVTREDAVRKWRTVERQWEGSLLRGSSRESRTHELLDVPPLVLRHPTAGCRLVTDWYAGHAFGKQAFRVDTDVTIANLHKVRFEGQQRSSSVNAGCLLHYNNYSAGKFVSKYRQSATHPDSYASGFPVDPAKRFLRDLVNQSRVRLDGLHALFRESFLFDVERMTACEDLWPGCIERVNAVAEFFKMNPYGCHPG